MKTGSNFGAGQLTVEMKATLFQIKSWLIENIPSYTATEAVICIAIVIDIIGLPLEKLKPSARFTEDLRADELEPVEIALAIEDELGVHIDDASAKNIATIEDLVRYVINAYQHSYNGINGLHPKS